MATDRFVMVGWPVMGLELPIMLGQSGGSFLCPHATIRGSLIDYPSCPVYHQTAGTAGFSARLELGEGGIYRLYGGTLGAETCVVGYVSVGKVAQTGGLAEINSLLIGETPGLLKSQYVLQDGRLDVSRGTVGYLGHGSFDQSGGSAAFLDNLILGHESSSRGTYNLSGGSLSGSRGTIGYRGIGEFNQSGGTNTVRNALYLGKDGGTGMYSLSGGLLAGEWDNVYVGHGGNGQFAQTGGTHVVGYLRLGGCSGTGTYALSGGLLTAYGETVGLSGGGSFTQCGGTNIAMSLEITAYHPYNRGTATYAFSGGLLATPSLQVGSRGGNGSFAQSGGTAALEGNLVLGTGTFRLSGGVLSVGSGTIGYWGTGIFDQSGGTAAFLDNLILGYESSDRGTYNLSGGSLSATRGTIGYYGTGEFSQSGGTARFRDVILGHEPGSTGTYTLSGGSLVTVMGTVGYQGVGEFHQSGGSAIFSSICANRLVLGHQPGGTGTYELADGYLWASGPTVGYQGLGQVRQTGGTFEIYRLTLGADAGGTGRYAIEGGLLDGDGYGYVGDAGLGEFIQTGGTVRFPDTQTGQLYLGRQPGSHGSYLLEDGFLQVARTLYVGQGGTAALTQTGGSVTAFTVILGQQSGSTGTYTQSGGTACFEGLLVGCWESATGTYELSGGWLHTEARVYRVDSGGSPPLYDLHVGPQGLFIQTGGLHTGYGRTVEGQYVLSGGTLRSYPLYVRPQGQFIQTGGLHTGSGWVSSVEGQYTLSGGTLRSYAPLYVRPQGLFIQTGGLHSGDVRVEGQYTLSGGSLRASSLSVVNEFILGRWADLSTHYLSFGHSGAHSPVFHAEPFSTIRMTGAGARVSNYATDPAGLADLVNLWMIFEGSGPNLGWFEVAGKDLGPAPAGYEDNFALGVLELAGAGLGRRFTLRGDFDNQPDWSGREALYLDTLILHQGVLLDPAGLSLYYRNHSPNVKRFFVADVDLDGAVDGGDLALMSGSWGRGDGLADRVHGDLNGDGRVDGGDLALLGGEWGKRTEDWAGPAPPPVGDQALPEPAALLLLAAGAAILTARRR